jgi:hypothetical protein
LIPRLHITGAAISSTASYTTSTVLTLWFFVRQSGIPVRNVLMPTMKDIDFLFSQARVLFQRNRIRETR